MHPLLPFYALFSLMAVLGFSQRDQAERSVVWLAGWGAMLVMLTGVILRDTGGDTSRYLTSFGKLQDTSLFDTMAASDGNVLFTALNWLFAQLGTDPLWLIVPVTVICILLMRHSLRSLLTPGQTAIAILLYSAYPFFIFYISNGMKQAIAMACLMQGYVFLWHRRPLAAGLLIGAAVLFHNGVALVLPFLALHLLIWRPGFGYPLALKCSIGLLLFCILLALTNLNQSLLSSAQGLFAVDARYDIYFEDAETYDYRAGFRPDFTLFSCLPLFAAWWLQRKGKGLTAERSGWWFNLYVLLACIYQLFAFAPFADRFAGFGWYLIPAILMIMLRETGARRPLQIVVLISAIFNIAILQFYTGRNLHVSL